MIPTLRKTTKSRSNKRPSTPQPKAPASTPRAEVYSRARAAEFLLNNSVTAEDYEAARREVKRMGIDPDTIEHKPPKNH